MGKKDEKALRPLAFRMVKAVISPGTVEKKFLQAEQCQTYRA